MSKTVRKTGVSTNFIPGWKNCDREVFAVYRNGWDSGFLTFLGDVVFGDYIAAAHAFMLAMGVGMVYSRKNDPTSTFVFVDWYIFVAVGIFLGSLLRSSDDPDGFYRKMLWSGIIAGAYIAATVINGPFWLSPDQDYYRAGIVDAAGLLSMDFFALAVFYFVLKKTGAERFSVFIEMSRNITVIYVIHWCILGLTDFACGDIFGLVFSYPVIYAIGAVLLLVSFYLARLWRSYRNGHSVKIPAD